MKLHEYQSKFHFAKFGVPIPQGKVAETPDEAAAIAEELGGTVVIKAQVQVGGRGKAGGVKLAKSPDEAREVASQILGMDLKGLEVQKVLIDPAADIKDELYLAVTTDRAARRVLIMASTEGGVDIEEVNAKTPEKIIRVHVDPNIGLRSYQAVDIASEMGLPREHWRQFGRIVQNLYRCYTESDASLAEINPLIIDGEGNMVAVDGKMIIDDSALYRQKDLAEQRDTAEEDPLETEAREADVAYIKLDGNIGCMVNGAGLAMATLDIIKRYGGEPANFLDTAGGANAEKVAKAFRLLLTDENVKAILVNIFGGITRCDEVAQGILDAMKEVEVTVPMVVRLVGTNDVEGRAMLADTDIITAETLSDAAQKVVEAAKSAS
ncbi:MAG: ADP-forming succinate--CoA ligase subunit beta [Chloroflexi bacterium]|nr:ADP-forming succinate--CoA ligase subunit beta [Chloroflexota bacterium]